MKSERLKMKTLKTLFVLFVFCGIVFSQTSLQSGHFSTAAQKSSGGQFSLNGSAGQLAIDNSVGENINLQGGFWLSIPVTITSINELELPLPFYFELRQNYPNPFNPITVIEYQLAEDGLVDLLVYNLLGQKVATLVSGEQSAGVYKITWDASSFSSGLYFYRLETDNSILMRRMLLVK